MTQEANQLLAAAMKSVGLNGSFSPAEIGARAGLNEMQAASAARTLSNEGILVLGFDLAAHFSVDYRKHRAKTDPKPAKKKKTKLHA